MKRVLFWKFSCLHCNLCIWEYGHWAISLGQIDCKMCRWWSESWIFKLQPLRRNYTKAFLPQNQVSFKIMVDCILLTSILLVWYLIVFRDKIVRTRTFVDDIFVNHSLFYDLLIAPITFLLSNNLSVCLIKKHLCFLN